MHSTTRLIAACLIGLAAQGAQAQEPYGPTAEETRMLPPYCGGPGVPFRAPNCEFNNHTCYGINFLNRYYRASQGWKQKNYLQNALGDFNYSVGHVNQSCVLMPEIYYYRGLTYRLMGREAEAMGDFLKSSQLDPKYSKSVAELADLYDRKLANPKKALELVTEGLRHNPASRELRRRYDRLGGKQPYPEPYEAPVAPASSKSAPAAPVPTPTPAQEAPAAAARTAAEPPPPTTATERPAGTAPQPATPGSPTNPWCRFCPDPAPAPDPAPSTPAAEPKAAP